MARREWAGNKVSDAQRRHPKLSMVEIAGLVAEAEHAMAVRIVQKIKRRHSKAQEDAIYSHGFTKACEDILKALKEGRA